MQGSTTFAEGDRPTARRVNLRTASGLSSFLRALVLVLSAAIILSVVIYLIELGSLIDYHPDQLRIVERLQAALQGLERRYTLPDGKERADPQSRLEVCIDDRQQGCEIYDDPIKSACQLCEGFRKSRRTQDF